MWNERRRGGVHTGFRWGNLRKTGHFEEMVVIIIIIIIYCNWVVTRWQWLFYMYTKHEIGYY